MAYQNEWLLWEAEDEIDEIEHRPPTEEFLFYQAVANGDLDAVRKNCEQERFLDSQGVGVLSRNAITNLKYHFVITTAMITRAAAVMTAMSTMKGTIITGTTMPTMCLQAGAGRLPTNIRMKNWTIW